MENAPDVARGLPCASRRAVLGSVGGLGMLLAVSACSSDETTEAAPPGDGTASGQTRLPSSAPSVDPASRQELIEAAAVPVGGGTVAEGVLVVQPIAGRFRAFEAACPHQGIRLGPPRQGVITCPAHSSRFRERDGALLEGPATRGLTKVAVVVDGGVVYRI